MAAMAALSGSHVQEMNAKGLLMSIHAQKFAVNLHQSRETNNSYKIPTTMPTIERLQRAATMQQAAFCSTSKLRIQCT